MAQIRVASLDNALMVVRNPPSDTGLRVAGLGATLPPPGGFCIVTTIRLQTWHRVMKGGTEDDR